MPCETIILVHGLWMTGMELVLLKHRLQAEYGYHCVVYSYSSVSGQMADHVRELRELAQQQSCERLHFIGHSLGGLILYNLLENGPDLISGRAVFLGSPLRGSSVARVMAGNALGRMMVGEAAINELTASQPRHWSGRRALGLIAGSDSLGLGRLLASELADHSDGTVSIEETRLEGATDHLVLPVSHTSMLFNAEVCRQAAYFLRQGQFDHAATAA